MVKYLPTIWVHFLSGLRFCWLFHWRDAFSVQEPSLTIKTSNFCKKHKIKQLVRLTFDTFCDTLTRPPLSTSNMNNWEWSGGKLCSGVLLCSGAIRSFVDNNIYRLSLKYVHNVLLQTTSCVPSTLQGTVRFTTYHHCYNVTTYHRFPT